MIKDIVTNVEIFTKTTNPPEMRDNRRRARKNAAKIMGKSYFTNPNSSLDSNHEYNHGNRRPGIFDIQANGS